jgi:hypothetical protein
MVEALVIAVLALLVVMSLGFAAWAAFIGGLGVLTGARWERCHRCHHYGLVTGDRLHERRCPPSHLAALPWGRHLRPGQH